MSFETLKEEELLAAAEMLAVDLDTCRTPKGKISPKLAAAAFAEEGVTWEIYQTELARLQAAAEKVEEEKRLEEERQAAVIRSQNVLGQDDDIEQEADEVVTRRRKPRARNLEPSQVLVKMDRQNPHYEVMGKVFTKDHPFVLMSEEEADRIFMADDGFRLATGREAAEYYS